ncbi:MAG: DUF1893 domain-containing protein [Oscillospiraceae bacterium]|nr:DUF1893 domain-containing protein [Oscillospiraceae bacterium]
MNLEIKRMIDNGECAIALCAADGTVITANGHTIAPLVTLAEDMAELFAGASVADRVIGKGAAAVLAWMGVKEVYGRLMSESGKEMLERHGVAASCSILVSSIDNNSRTGMCPLETLVEPIPAADLEACAKAVVAFAHNLRR